MIRLKKEFSDRLILSMKNAGHIDSRSPSGISVRTLAQVMGVSEQICRRYLRGDALPDYEKITDIALFLSVSPGWLLFGENNNLFKNEQTGIHIDAELLHYILERSHKLYMQSSRNSEDFSDFVLDLIKDVCTIDATNETLKKIIDLAVSSICSFEERKNKTEVILDFKVTASGG
jgi:transcriptional regulator with XRE-family HTH domain